jgi:hypothetical protein
MSGKRCARGLAAVLAVTLVPAASAQAAGNSVAVHAPNSVKLGHRYKIRTSGYVVAPADYVVGFEATPRCRSTYRAELRRLNYPSRAPLVLKNVSGHFSKTVGFKAKTGGTVYWCAYVINGDTLKTYATAFAHFSER